MCPCSYRVADVGVRQFQSSEAEGPTVSRRSFYKTTHRILTVRKMGASRKLFEKVSKHCLGNYIILNSST